MKVVILAGGLGTRISEESVLRPKPMIEIGEMPILWHIMKIYSYFGFNDFVICAGYKQHVIKEWFANYHLHILDDISFDFSSRQSPVVIRSNIEPWRVTVAYTGLHTQTGGRIKRIREYIGNEPFFLTYGDAVGNMDIPKILKTHKESGKTGTISVYNFGQAKGVVDIGPSGDVVSFREKSNLDGDLINIGFMVFEPSVFDLIDGDDSIFEKDVLPQLAIKGELGSYLHDGFWQCMDTMNEKKKLEDLWVKGNAPWKIWN